MLLPPLQTSARNISQYASMQYAYMLYHGFPLAKDHGSCGLSPRTGGQTMLLLFICMLQRLLSTPKESSNAYTFVLAFS